MDLSSSRASRIPRHFAAADYANIFSDMPVRSCEGVNLASSITQANMMKKNAETESTTDASQMGAAHHSSPLVILELKSNRNIEFLDVTPLPETVSWSAKLDFEDMWAQEGLCVGNPEFTSGRVFLEEMLHGMISFTLPISRFCMDTRIIDHFVEVSHLISYSLYCLFE